jgi:hypothetical protein
MNGIELITQERARQIERKGYDAKWDANNNDKELAMAACYYAAPENIEESRHTSEMDFRITLKPDFFFPPFWDRSHRKRDGKTEVQRLTVAGALIAAEIDRLLSKESE